MKRISFFLVVIFVPVLSTYAQDPPNRQDAGDKRYTVVADGPPRDRGVSGGVLNGKAITLPKPVYPSAARAVKASGTVSVQVLIGEDGSVITAAAVSGHPLLRSAAVEAARGAKFAPTRLAGNPVKVSGVIVYNFVGATPVEQVILGIGYDLTDGELSRSFNSGSVKGEMPSTWTEERALLDKIARGIEKYSADNPPPSKAETKSAAISGAGVTSGSEVKLSTDPTLSGNSTSTGDANRYTVIGSYATTAPAGGRFGDETLADIVELQALIDRRFADNPVASWYFKLGQALGRLENLAADKDRFPGAVNELQILAANIPAGATDSLRTRLNELLTAAEAARVDTTKTDDVIARVKGLRDR